LTTRGSEASGTSSRGGTGSGNSDQGAGGGGGNARRMGNTQPGIADSGLGSIAGSGNGGRGSDDVEGSV